jgi:hypothetical protein
VKNVKVYTAGHNFARLARRMPQIQSIVITDISSDGGAMHEVIKPSKKLFCLRRIQGPLRLC